MATATGADGEALSGRDPVRRFVGSLDKMAPIKACV
jgi:hypothetical protein